MDYKPEGRRKIGRPKLRGIDGLLQDMKKLEVKNRWRVATDREARRKVLAVELLLLMMMMVIMIMMRTAHVSASKHVREIL
jgi:hypothetical protein